MTKRSSKQKVPVAVVGAGSFGLTVAQLLAVNNDVLLNTRDPQVAQNINETRTLLGIKLAPRVTAISSYPEIAEQCEVIFPVVPSDDFRDMMRNLGPLLSPRHILIHGTKGLDTVGIKDVMAFGGKVYRDDVCTMSKVITQESNVLRVGCLSGPNRARKSLKANLQQQSSRVSTMKS